MTSTWWQVFRCQYQQEIAVTSQASDPVKKVKKGKKVPVKPQLINVILKVIILSIVMLNVIMLSIIMLNVIVIKIVILNVIKLSIIILKVILLSIVTRHEQYCLKIFVK
jgi:hypothetical protein